MGKRYKVPSTTLLKASSAMLGIAIKDHEDKQNVIITKSSIVSRMVISRHIIPL